MDITILITQMIELFIIMFLGYLIYKLKVVDDHFVTGLSGLIIKVSLPAMILASVLNLTERQSTYDVMIALGVAASLFFVLLPVAGLLIAKALRVKKSQLGLYTFMATYSNVGFMGFPIIKALSGDVGLFYAAIFNLIFNLSIYTFGVWLMNRDKAEKSGFDFKLLLSPGVIISVLAIAIYFANIKFPSIINETVDMVGSITSPAAMLVIGCTLAKMDIKSVFSDWRIYPWTIIKQLVIPLLLWIPFTMIIKNEMLLTVSFVLSTMPIANSAVLFANLYGGDTELAAKSVFITTLISLVSVPLCVWLVM